MTACRVFRESANLFEITDCVEFDVEFCIVNDQFKSVVRVLQVKKKMTQKKKREAKQKIKIRTKRKFKS